MLHFSTYRPLQRRLCLQHPRRNVRPCIYNLSQSTVSTITSSTTSTARRCFSTPVHDAVDSGSSAPKHERQLQPQGSPEQQQQQQQTDLDSKRSGALHNNQDQRRQPQQQQQPLQHRVPHSGNHRQINWQQQQGPRSWQQQQGPQNWQQQQQQGNQNWQQKQQQGPQNWQQQQGNQGWQRQQGSHNWKPAPHPVHRPNERPNNFLGTSTVRGIDPQNQPSTRGHGDTAPQPSAENRGGMGRQEQQHRQQQYSYSSQHLTGDSRQHHERENYRQHPSRNWQSAPHRDFPHRDFRQNERPNNFLGTVTARKDDAYANSISSPPPLKGIIQSTKPVVETPDESVTQNDPAVVTHHPTRMDHTAAAPAIPENPVTRILNPVRSTVPVATNNTSFQQSSLRPSWRSNTAVSSLAPPQSSFKLYDDFLQGLAPQREITPQPSTASPETENSKQNLLEALRTRFIPQAKGTDTKPVSRISLIGDLVNKSPSSTKGSEAKTFLSSYVGQVNLRREEDAKAGGRQSPILARESILRSSYGHRIDYHQSPDKQRLQAALFERLVKQKEEEEKDRTAGRDRKRVVLPNFSITLIEASELIRVRTEEIRRVLKSLGDLPSGLLQDEDINIEPDTLQLVALELGIDFEVRESSGPVDDNDILLKRRACAETGEGNYAVLPPRPPVVCIMGHVDHGKTTLMDTLRRMSRGADVSEKKKSKKEKKKAKTAGSSNDAEDVAGTEAGGITQVISAFQVPLPGHKMGAVTFLDTPGHAAFKSMRQSGSDAADIIVLVIAADDGVSPQTVEILNFYKSIVQSSGGGGISLVIAMNKIDKPGINVSQARARIENQLMEHGIFTEGMGGSDEGYGTPAQLFPISGLTGQGVDDLIEGLALQSEVMDLRADDTAKAEGYIMDARVEKGLGTVVDAVIRWGSIKKGDFVMSGVNSGRVKLLKDSAGKPLDKGAPSQPICITGFSTMPKAGDPFVCVSQEEFEQQIKRREALAHAEAMANESVVTGPRPELQSAGNLLMRDEWRDKYKAKLGIQTEEDEDRPIRIPVILRANADGSLAALRESLIGLGEQSTYNVVLDPLVESVGPLLQAEVELAKEANATIICFNVKESGSLMRDAEEGGVTILSSDIIYRLLEGAKEKFGKYLPKKKEETIHGRAKVGAIYDIKGQKTKIAGLTVFEGTLYKDKALGAENKQVKCFYRVLRKGEVVTKKVEVKSTSLKHFKDDVEEISRGNDCGLSLEDHNDYEEGDVIECFSYEMKHQPI